MKKIVLLLALTFFGMKANSTVWSETETWTPEMEQKYSDWIKNEFNEDFFMKGKWAGVPTDCADAVYTARLIFSYENKLPFSIKDPTGSSNRITNSMSRFNYLKNEDRRIREFITYVKDMTNTKTLGEDTYPSQINRQSIKPGSVWIRASIVSENFFVKLFANSTQAAVTSHAETVKEISDSGVVFLLGSTVPSRVRNLTITSSFVYYPKNTSLGLRNWILPQNASLATEAQPGFSLEQYQMAKSICPEGNDNSLGSSNCLSGGSPTESAFTSTVHKALAMRAELKDETIQRYAKELCSLAQSRADVVKETSAFKEKNNRCMTQEEYDGFSTPSRDKRITDTTQNLLKLEGSQNLFVSRNEMMRRVEPLFASCPAIDLGQGQQLSILDYIRNVYANKISSNPNDSVQARWGLASPDSNCPKF